MAARLRSARAFTLIELLVVILILGILIAVAAPSFLGQTEKAHDSTAKQYLTVAYKAAKASTVKEPYTGDYDATTVILAINAEGSGLSATSGVCPSGVTSTDPKNIIVDPAGTSSDDLRICNDPKHRVFTLVVTNHGSPVINGPIIVDSSQPAPAAVSGSGPQITGTAQVGSTLTASAGSWSNSPTSYSYQWQSSPDLSTWTNASGAGAATNTYSVANADLGNRLRVTVTATNAGGTASAPSSATTAVAQMPAPTYTSGLSISGQAVDLGTLTASPGTWTNATGFNYQWQSSTDGGTSWANVAGATSVSYPLLGADGGSKFRVVVTGTGPGGSGASQTSSATTAVLNRIVFASTEPGNYDIYSIWSDGSGRTRLTTDPSTDYSPGLMPDGRILWANAGVNGGIWIMNADGSNKTRLTTDNGDSNPTTDVAGDLIVLRRGAFAWAMNPDGSNLHQVVAAGAAYSPALSPNGTKIAFDNDASIGTMNIDGSNKTFIDSSGVRDLGPYWSPDGTKLVFQCRVGGVIWQTCTMSSSNGSGWTQLTSGTNYDGQPSYLANGKIVFASARDRANGDFTYELYTMNGNGSGQTRVAVNAFSDMYPVGLPR